MLIMPPLIQAHLLDPFLTFMLNGASNTLIWPKYLQLKALRQRSQIRFSSNVLSCSSKRFFNSLYIVMWL